MYWIEVTLRNDTGGPMTTTIPKGTVVEVADARMQSQSLVVQRDVRVTLPPGQHTIKVPGLCLNRDLASPSGVPGRLTVFRLAAPFQTQDEVWNLISAS
jgi:hypothetical protein